MHEITHYIWCVRFFYLSGYTEKERLKIFEEDVRAYPIYIGKENKFECVVIGSRVWPCRYRVDNVAVNKKVSNERICR